MTNEEKYMKPILCQIKLRGEGKTESAVAQFVAGEGTLQLTAAIVRCKLSAKSSPRDFPKSRRPVVVVQAHVRGPSELQERCICIAAAPVSVAFVAEGAPVVETVVNAKLDLRFQMETVRISAFVAGASPSHVEGEVDVLGTVSLIS